MKLLISKLFIVFIGLLTVVSCNNSNKKISTNIDNQPFIADASPINWGDLKTVSIWKMLDHNFDFVKDSVFIPYAYKFLSSYTNGNKQLAFELNLFFASNTADSMVGIYSLYIPHDTAFYNKYDKFKYVKKLNSWQQSYTLIENNAVGIFRIIKDSLFLEQSLPLHYQDSLCKKLPALDTCMCNCAHTQRDSYYEALNKPTYETGVRIFDVPEFKNSTLKVAFSLEIEPTTFSLHIIPYEKIEPILGLHSYSLKYKSPVVILNGQENLKINHWASQKDIYRKHPDFKPKQKIHYPLFEKKELDIKNTYTVLSGYHEFSKYLTRVHALLVELTDKKFYEFGRCGTVDILDIYELLLGYTTKERLKREKK